MGSLLSVTPTQHQRVLCLDGGGIRGLVIIELLKEIERLTGKQTRESFDWICGTSAGGILALALAKGMELDKCEALLLRVKDETFKGLKPYNVEPYEKILKEVFGETETMKDLPPNPRIAVTAVTEDYKRLHLFRNYDYDGSSAPATDDIIWKVARSTGAAPGFFPPFDGYLDGGLMANNPTIAMINDIIEYYENEEEKSQLLKVVVSLGTGQNPDGSNEVIDIHFPTNLADIFRVVASAKNLLMDMITRNLNRDDAEQLKTAKNLVRLTGGQYVRFEPTLSKDVPLDCSDQSEIDQMLKDTQDFIKTNAHVFEELVTTKLN